MANLSLLLLLLLLNFTTVISTADDATSFIYAGCSQPKYTPNSPYQYNVESLLSSLANSASFSSYSNFTSSSPAISALFQCHPHLSPSSCSSCIRSALSLLPSFCPSAASATLQLHSCYLRYGNDSFLSLPDTSLLYKICSSPVDSPFDSLDSRDRALSSLSGGGSYREGTAGGVRAEAQCVGDLSGDQCSSCVRAAAAQGRAACGGAAAGGGDLGKWYIRYSSNEARPYAYANGGGGGSDAGEHGDDTGKTLAIIIGLMAGVALIIVFLSFIKRSGSGKY
ncbi:cysteine-rich repeat secretory protein 12-like [Phalaenopsis equestris]|uniref:cysteine-rich repeat secretory protein 12-like n=1 Tax=Phalaenopsis equestris TaxID=78828 RepID=UPI0009E63F72|nr:cysteine-rich repeat secretory protein 12-like [Phalaenopsis equestris]